MLELAVLGLLHDSAVHGYELRKQLQERLGPSRRFSWGSLYPTLRRLQRAGLISEQRPETVERPDPGDTARGARGLRRRDRRVYEITGEGKDRLEELLADVGPQAWDDEGFGVHLAFFARTPVDVRVRILEGRRRRVEERREGLRTTLTRTGEQIDRYTRELHRIGLESTEREVRWLNELLAHERAEAADRASLGESTTLTDSGHPVPGPIDDPRP